MKSDLRVNRALPAFMFLFFALLSIGPLSMALQAQVLLKQPDLVYQGAFRLPGGRFGGSSFDYGGSALAYNPSNDSLFIVGHAWQQMVAEISIPSIVNSTDIKQLLTAGGLQAFTDLTEGRMSTTPPASAMSVGGLMIHNGQLYVSVFASYDANGSQTLSHFRSGLNFSVQGDVQGPFQVGNMGAGFVSGYMTQIPQAWQTSFGAPAITGNCCLNIISRTSWGPSAFAFNPSDLSTKNPVPDVALVYYTSAHPTLGGWDKTGPYFNGATAIHGLVFPEGTRSVLYFGRHGVGPFCYGTGTADPTLTGTPTGQGDVYCYDPIYGSKGNHAYPYVYQVWAYDAQDLVAVKKNEKNPWDVSPYAVWSFELPFQNDSRQLGGVAYDPATQRIFVVQSSAEAAGMPMVHVWKVHATTNTTSTTINPSRSHKRVRPARAGSR